MRNRVVPAFLASLAVTAALGAQPFDPPACGGAPFADVPAGHPLCPWIGQLKADGISAGCGGGNYCPDAPLTRAQAAMLLERALRGTATWEPAQGLFAHTVIVKPVPGDPDASGLRLLQALGDIDDAANDNRYLLWIEPGRYDLNTSLHLKSFVTIQGASRSQVEIHASSTTTAGFGDSQAVLRSLTFWVNSSGSNVLGFNQTLGGRIEDVTFEVFGPLAVTGLKADSSLENVSVVASGTTAVTAILLGDGYYSLTDVQAYASSADGGAVGIDFASTAGDVTCLRCQARIGGGNGYSLPLRVSSVGDSNTFVLRDAETYAGVSVGDHPLAAGLQVLEGKVVVEDSRLEADPDASVVVGVDCKDAVANTLVEIHHSRLIGSDATVRAPANGNCQVRIGGSQLRGGAVDDGGSGTVDCVALYGDGFTSPGINSCF
jgi:hypothetical protein